MALESPTNGTKRRKLSNRLDEISDWPKKSNIAVEYYDFGKTIKFTYNELDHARIEVKSVLSSVKDTNFIGIDCNVLRYCIPALLIGINSSGLGFVNLPSSQSLTRNMCHELKMKYVFSHVSLPKSEIIRTLKVHGETLNLVKLENNVTKETESASFAYAISTSGTTGIPKIIKVPHSSIVPNIRDLKTSLGISNADKIAQLTTLTFDPSIVEIFLALSSACTLFMVSKQMKNHPQRLLQELYREKVTVLQTTPSVLLHKFSKSNITDTILSSDTSLRILLLGGEPLPPTNVLSQLKHKMNNTRIFGLYGITEVSCWASISEICSKTDVRCLGEPLSETIFEVRDEKNQRILEGEGSLFIGSMSRCCVLSNEAISVTTPIFRDSGDLVKIDRDGNIFYITRRDDVIKRLGNKLNLKNLRDRVLNISYIDNCFVYWDEEKLKLHLFVTSLESKDSNTLRNDIRSNLRDLPEYYQPNRIHLIDKFRLNENEKIDKSFFEHYVANENFRENVDIEEIFHEIWYEYFPVESTAGFTSLGGTSVIAIEMVDRLSNQYSATEFPELIGMLLGNCDYKHCLDYIKKIVETNDKKNRVTENKIEQSCTNIWEKRNEEIVQKNSFVWQKCKGRTYLNNQIDPDKESLGFKPSRIEIIDSFDLEKCVDASPTVFKYHSQTFATVGAHSGIICTISVANPTECREYYKIRLPDRIEASVLVLDDFKGVVGTYDGNVYCVDLRNGEIFWKCQTGDSVKCTCIINEKQNIFFGSYDKNIYCLSSKDGSQIWKRKASEGSISATGSLKENSIAFGTLDGTCVLLEQDTGEIQWKRKLNYPIFASPCISSTNLLIVAEVSGNVHCYNSETDEEVWNYTIAGNIFSYPVIFRDLETNLENLLVASKHKNLITCLELSRKIKLKYQTEFSHPIVATPWKTEELLITATTDGNVCVALKDESVIKVKVKGDIYSSPVVYQDLIIVGCRDNSLYILKLMI